MQSLPDFSAFPPIRGAIFDFNGTLFWDTHEHDASWILCMRERGVQVTADELFERFHGKPNETIICGLLGKNTSEAVLREIIAEKERIYQTLCLEKKMEFAPGAVSLLDFLKENQVPLTVATSAPLENIEFYCRHLNIERWFDREKIVFFDGTFPGKPHPEFYSRAMRKIGCTPAETVIFEDAPSGILAAENAGCRNIVCVNSENVDYDALRGEKNPYPVIRNFDDVPRRLFLLPQNF